MPEVMARESELKGGIKVGDWELQEYLGDGGQGEVWRVRYRKGQRPAHCAMKMCFSSVEKHRQRFASEIKVLSSIEHPHVVPVIDQGEVATIKTASRTLEFSYYVMPLATRTVEQAVRANHGLQTHLRWFGELLDAMTYMHERGLLHRDLKPSNLLLVDPGDGERVMVSDFGLAREFTQQDHLTATHELVGSIPYMAPELLAGATASIHSDVFALGRILHFLRTGQHVVQHNQKVPNSLGDLTDRAGMALEATIARATSFGQSDRYASVRELVQALPRLILDLEATPEPHRVRPPIVVRPEYPIGPREPLGHWNAHDGRAEREVRWKGGSHVFLWVAPAAPSERRWTSHELRKIQERGHTMLHSFEQASSYSWTRNQHGFAVFGVPYEQEGGIDVVQSFSMATSAAQVWSINSYLCSLSADLGNGERASYLPVGAIEDRLIRQLEHAGKYLKQGLAVSGPFVWSAGLRWIRNFRLGLGQGFLRPYSEPTYEDEIIGEGTFDDTHQRAADVMLPLFRRAWDSFGLDRPDSR